MGKTTSNRPILWRVGVRGSKEGLALVRAMDEKSAIDQWKKEHGGKSKSGKDVEAIPDSAFDPKP